MAPDIQPSPRSSLAETSLTPTVFFKFVVFFLELVAC